MQTATRSWPVGRVSLCQPGVPLHTGGRAAVCLDPSTLWCRPAQTYPRCGEALSCSPGCLSLGPACPAAHPSTPAPLIPGSAEGPAAPFPRHLSAFPAPRVRTPLSPPASPHRAASLTPLNARPGFSLGFHLHLPVCTLSHPSHPASPQEGRRCAPSRVGTELLQTSTRISFMVAAAAGHTLGGGAQKPEATMQIRGDRDQSDGGKREGLREGGWLEGA